MRRSTGLRYIYEARFGVGASLVQECFAVVGVAVGVALLFASQVASTSLTHAVAQLNTELVGSAQLQLKARGYEGVPEEVITGSACAGRHERPTNPRTAGQSAGVPC